MASISTSSALALQAIRSVNQDLTKTQNRISTGLKVASAKDNAGVWATAQTIRSEVAGASAIDDGISTLKGKIDVSSTSAAAVSDLLVKIRDKLTAAQASGADLDSIGKEIASYQAQITATVNGAKFQNVNLLDGSVSANQAVVIGTSADGTTTSMTLTHIADMDMGKSTGVLNANGTASGVSILAFAVTSSTPQTTATATTLSIANMITQVADALTSVNKAAAAFGSFSNALESTQGFLKTLNTVKQSALSNMVDADMEEESAKLQALQTKQQLAYQGLSIANQANSNILRLFQ